MGMMVVWTVSEKCRKERRQPYNEEKIKDRNKKKMKVYICLTSLPAWWARVEKEEKQFYKEVEKGRMEKKKKETKNAEKKKEKENFIKNSSRTAIPHLAELLT